MTAIETPMTLNPEDYSSHMELTDDSAPAPVVETPPVVAAPSPAADPAPKVEDKPADPPAGDVPPVVEPKLYKLPDGREVDSDGLRKEYENLLPEFTRKSQRLAELEGGKTEITKVPEEPKWKKADYVPENYGEVIETAKAEALAELRAEAQADAAKAAAETAAEAARVKEIHDSVEAQLTEIKVSDPKLDSEALFAHANKYGFSDLKAAYANMTDMRKVAVDTEQRTVKNIKGRDADPIAGSSGGATSPDEAYDPAAMSQYSSAQDYLARIKSAK